MEPTNNARIHCNTTYVPVARIRCLDRKQKIWKGERIIEPGTPKDHFTFIYFSRNYNQNDWDKMNPEYHITNKNIIGFEFWLIPKEKMLFGYDPPSVILKPSIKPSNRRMPL